ncbi:MAG: anhydro-N-acetylmuramic acid kinase [Flavobacteriaceae bacterium]|nr:anhydro-N-acetylmuramic acid kinase [Flavobacteriaceae bacterium]
MLPKNYNVVGVMSGTSLDGVDLAYIAFAKSNTWTYKIHKAVTITYPETWKKRLQNGVYLCDKDLLTLNKEYTQYLGGIIKRFISSIDGIPPQAQLGTGIDAICSHGHTILHQLEKGVTLQIGNLPELADYVQQTVVCDFRVQDVALGGQGAPLVPIGDQLLFPEYEYCLNLGGFANVSYEDNNKRIAFDICPVNIVLNALAEKLGIPFDEDGQMAKKGRLIPELLQHLNALEYYNLSHPKSLGLEWVQKHIFPILDKTKASTEDLLHTFTEHIAIQLANTFKVNTSVLVSGGGTYNWYLLERLKNQKKINLVLPSKELIEYKEALVFGLLGVLKLRGEVNCLASVTGAERDHSSGKIFRF